MIVSAVCSGSSSSMKKEIAVAADLRIRVFPLVDAMGVHDDPAALRLPKYARQSDHGEPFGVYDVPQDVACAHGRQLVCVPPRMSRMEGGMARKSAFMRMISIMEASSTMRASPVKWVFLISFVSFRRLAFQQPVYGFGFHPGHFWGTAWPPGRQEPQGSPSVRKP